MSLDPPRRMLHMDAESVAPPSNVAAPPPIASRDGQSSPPRRSGRAVRTPAGRVGDCLPVVGFLLVSFEALTCSRREEGLSCQHGVKPPLTHSLTHLVSFIKRIIHSSSASFMRTFSRVLGHMTLHPCRLSTYCSMVFPVPLWRDDGFL